MYKQLEIKPGRERSIYNRHPWLFSGAVKILPAAVRGEIIAIVDDRKNILAHGFYFPQSEIVCRIFDFEKRENDYIYSENFWKKKIADAFEFRKKYILNNETNCCRILHSEGDGVPGMIIDKYATTAVVQPLHSGVESIMNYVFDALKECGIENIYIKTKKSSQQIEEVKTVSEWYGNAEQKIIVKENNLLFSVDVVDGQKTGFFLDQRENRKLLKDIVKDKKVLNAFSYTGGFSVYAAAGKAKEIVSVDISKDAISECEENMKLNFPLYKNHKTFVADCFEFLKETENDFDVIVLDPPAFAKNARSVKNATRGYKEINLNAMKKIKSGGWLFTFSCSKNIDRDLFRKIIFGAAADAKREVKILYQLSQPADHPINIFHPEGEYLKGLVLEII